MHKISIIMSTYNDEKFIWESIESILNQSFEDFEFIIINDCSKDNTSNIIKKYQEKDERIRVINNNKNIWLTKNLNKWLKLAKWKYIARMDADDIALKDRLKTQYEYLEKNKDIFLIWWWAEVIDEKWNFKYNYKPICWVKKVSRTLEKWNCIYHPTIMFRNEWFLYREKFVYTQDYDFYLTLLSAWKKIDNICDKLIKYRVNSNSISWTKNSKQRLFREKAKEFYFQRKKNWKDNYDKFDNKEILEIDVKNSTNKIVLQWQIVSNFELWNFKESRLYSKKYFKYYGVLNKYLFYYLLSFTNKSIISFIKKII